LTASAAGSIYNLRGSTGFSLHSNVVLAVLLIVMMQSWCLLGAWFDVNAHASLGLLPAAAVAAHVGRVVSPADHDVAADTRYLPGTLAAVATTHTLCMCCCCLCIAAALCSALHILSSQKQRHLLL
jgi:hypothetical protein